MPIVLCVHPLSEKFRETVEQKVAGEVEYMPLAAVKPKGAVQAVRYLLSRKTDAVYVVFEEAEEVIMMPIISMVSLLIRARRRFLIDSTETVTELGAMSILGSVGNVVLGSLAALKSGIIAWVELGALERNRPKAYVTRETSNVVYLNTNVNLGVKAGGSLGHIAGVVNELHKRGFNLLYVATRRFSVIDPAVPMHKLALPSLPGIPMDLFIFGFSQHIYRQIRGMFRDGVPRVIYQRMSRSDYTGAKLSRKLGVPLIIEYNGSEAWGARHWGHPMLFERLARKAELVSLRSAQAVVTISEVLADELVEIGIDRSRIVVYPNCVDSDVFDPARFPQSENDALRSRHGIDPDATVLGFVGTFGRWHGVDILCDAITLLAREQSEWMDRHSVRFLIVGDGFLGRLVGEIASSEITRKYVVWPGLVEQKMAPAYLAAMDILLSPHVDNPDGTRFFGSPTKLFEYMSMERPVIASRLEQIEDVLAPGLDAGRLPSGAADEASAALALLVEPGNARQLAEAIRFLVERRDWRDILARNARAEVQRKYQWSHHVAKIIDGVEVLTKDLRIPAHLGKDMTAE